MQTKLVDGECELPFHFDNNSNITDAIIDDAATYHFDEQSNQFDANASQMRTTTSSPNLRQNDADNTSWWLNSIPYDNDTTTIDQTLPYHGTSMRHKLRHIDSGELPWWMTETEDVTVADDITLDQSEADINGSILDDNSQPLNIEWPAQNSDNAWSLQKDTNEVVDSVATAAADSDNRPFYKITHIRSGERAWWMDDNNNDTNIDSKEDNVVPSSSIDKPPVSEEEEQPSLWVPSEESRWRYPIKYVNRMQDDIEQPWWMKNDEPEKTRSPSMEDRECAKIQQTAISCEDYTRLPLGDRASPEGLEDMSSKQRLSASYSDYTDNKQSEKNDKKLYISRYANVDDLLGGSCTLSSMLLDRFNGDVFEEITPAQVRIHDSTAKMPFIHRMSDDK